MSAFTPIKSNKPSKVRYTEYIRTEDKQEEGAAAPTTPSEPTKPAAE